MSCKAATWVACALLLVFQGPVVSFAGFTPVDQNPSTQTAIVNIGATLTSYNFTLYIVASGATVKLAAEPDGQFFIPIYSIKKQTPNLFNSFALFSVAAQQFLVPSGGNGLALLSESKVAARQLWWTYDSFGRLISSSSGGDRCLSIVATTAYPAGSLLSLVPCATVPKQTWLALPKVPGTYNGTVKSLFSGQCLDTTYANLRTVACGEAMQRRIQTFQLIHVSDAGNGARYYRLYSTWAKKYIVFNNKQVAFVSDPSFTTTATYSSDWNYNSRGQFRSAADSSGAKNCLALDNKNFLTIDPVCANSNIKNRWLFSSPY